MQNKFKNSHLSLFLFVAISLLQSCGGASNKTPTYAITADISTTNFSNEFLQISDDTQSVNVTFEGDGLLIGFAPDVQPVSWLRFRTENVTNNSATIFIEVINAENVIPDLYKTKLRISTGDATNANLVHHDIDVSLLVWQLITDKTIVSFRGTFGDVSIDTQTLAISSEANNWTAESDVDWLALDVTSGTGDGVITITPNLANLNNAQLYQGSITLTETTTGDSKKVPVEIGLDRHYLYSNQATISFSKLANISATSKTLIIATNSPSSTEINWQATSNVEWLSLTKSTNSNELVVSIKPEVSFTQAQNNALITIAALDSENNIDESVINEVINVSYYQSNEKSENKILSNVITNSNSVINSTYLPHLYIGENNQLKIYHQYTAELIATIDVSPINTKLEQLIVHPDGQFLLAKADETITNEDETTSILTHRYRINLSDYSITTIDNTTIEFEPLKWVTFSGRNFIVTQTLEYADENLQRQFWNRDNAYFTNQVDQALNTEAFYALDLSDSSFKRYQAKVNDFTTESIVVVQTHQYRPELLAENQVVSSFVVDDKESGIYAISPTSEWISFDGTVFTDNGLLAQDENSVTLALTKSKNNRALYARFIQTSGFIIDIYNEQQVLTNSVNTQGEQPRDITLSQDDKRLIINARNAEQIEIINLEQVKISTQNIKFRTTFGNNSIQSQEITISGVSDSWLAESSADWLVISTSTIDGQAIINVSIDQSKITTWGLFTATITVIDPQSGNTSVLNVELAVDEVRIYSNYPSLSFSSQLDKSKLSHTVDILTNKENVVAWQAQSNVNWITLTPDTINNKLTITVDPTKVTTIGLHSAFITLSPQVSGDSINSLININFSKGVFNTADFSELVIENITANSSDIILDPMRPYLYVAQADKIDVYNIIDGTKVNTIQSPLAGFELTNLVIHPDGSILITSNEETFLDDNEQQQVRTNYYHINLDDYTFTQLDSSTVDILSAPEKIIMTSGKCIVVTQALELANLSLTSQFFDNENTFSTNIITNIANNNIFVAYNPATLNLLHSTIEYNAFSEKSVKVTNTLDYINTAFSSGMSKVATSNDGKNIYTINSSSEWSTYDGESFADQGLLDGNPFTSPVDVTIDVENNSYIYRFDFTIGFFTLSKYDENQVNLWKVGYSAGSINTYISADYQRVIHYNRTENKLVIDFIPD